MNDPGRLAVLTGPASTGIGGMNHSGDRVVPVASHFR